MKPKFYGLLGGLSLLLALIFGVKQSSDEFSSPQLGERVGLFSNKGLSEEQGFISRKSRNRQSKRILRLNPVVGGDWRNLLRDIPLQPKPSEVSVQVNEEPHFFASECQFLARIWSKRLQLDSEEEAKLADELLGKRQERWQNSIGTIPVVTSNGKGYLFASTDKFEKELWAEHWVEEAWPILQQYQASRDSNGEERDLSFVKGFFELIAWDEEVAGQYLGAEGGELGEDSEVGGDQVAGVLREDEVLFLFWVCPMARKLYEIPEEHSDAT